MYKYKVCHCTSVHSPLDGRIFHKECKSLADAGYDVTLIAQHDKNVTIDGIKIVALPKPKNRIARIFKLIFKVLWLSYKQKSKIYHFHDPELIPIGIILKILGKKVIYDVHEDVPKQIMNKEWIGSPSLRKIVAFFAYIMEQFGALFFDGIVVVTPDIAEKFDPSKTEIIRNLPILKFIDTAKCIVQAKEKPIVIYTGGLSKIRGIKEIIQAMEYVSDKAELWLLGDWENEEFRKECEELKGWKYTKYLGYIPYGNHYTFIKIANIGIVTFLPAPNHESALPNKPFEYMACSLPIVMSDFPYWKEMFEGCALFADPHNPIEVADKIIMLLDDEKLRNSLGKRGRILIESEYSWEAESKKLLDFYENILRD